MAKQTKLIAEESRADLLEAALHSFCNDKTANTRQGVVDINPDCRELANFIVGYLGAGHIGLATMPNWTASEAFRSRFTGRA